MLGMFLLLPCDLVVKQRFGFEIERYIRPGFKLNTHKPRSPL